MTEAQHRLPGLVLERETPAGQFTFRHVSSPKFNLSTSVVLAVAEVLGVDQRTIDPPLAHVIDPDALDDLVRPLDATGRSPDVEVRFGLAGCRVVVQGDGHITVVPQEATRTETALSGRSRDDGR